jgi:hypothetical protein
MEILYKICGNTLQATNTPAALVIMVYYKYINVRKFTELIPLLDNNKGKNLLFIMRHDDMKDACLILSLYTQRS